MTRRKRKPARLRGWLFGIPFVALPFAVFFAEAHLHVGIRMNDYEIFEIDHEVRAALERIGALEQQALELSRLDLIDGQAPELGLVEARVHQIKVVYYTEGGGPDTGQRHLLASLGQPGSGGGGAGQ